MKKRVFQKWLVSTLLIVCVICATLCLFVPHLKSQASIGPEIHYYYKDSADVLVATADCSEFVSEIEPDETVNSVYVLNYEPYDMSYDQFADLNASKAEVDSVRKDFIQKSKAYYSSKNQEFLSSIGIDENSQDYQVVVSNYSPYVQISYEDKSLFQKYEDNFIDAVKSNSDISEIQVTVPVELEQQDATTVDVATPYDMNDVLSDIGADDQTYTGSGLRVGIIESKGVTYDYSHAELADLDIHTAGDSSTASDHTERVTRVLCGSNGVARGIGTVYIYHAPFDKSFISAMNWFIDNYCFVVNASLGIIDDAGKYTWASAFMDYQVRYNRVIFVNSAGNEGKNPNHYVNPPGTGYNAITVANSTKNAYIYHESSYDVESNLNMNKPNLAAPGTGVIRDKNNNIRSGTSYSAPIVTGFVLKLLEEKPGLQLFPEAVSAILMASATNANGQKDKWDTRAGAGIVNYKRAREILNNGTYGVFINRNNVNGSVVVSSGDFSAKKGDKIRAVAIWSANSKTSTLISNAKSNIHTNYDLILNYVGSNNDVMMLREGSTKNNMQFFVNEFKLLSKATLRIDLKQSANKISSEDDYGAIAWYCE